MGKWFLYKMKVMKFLLKVFYKFGFKFFISLNKEEKER